MTEEREGDDEADVRALDGALHLGMRLACEVNSGGLDVEGQNDVYREGEG